MQKKQSKPQISLTQQATGIVTFSAAQAKEYDDKMRITQVTNLYLLHHPWRVFLRKWFGVEIYLQGETGTRGQRRNFWQSIAEWHGEYLTAMHARKIAPEIARKREGSIKELKKEPIPAKTTS